MQSIRNLLSQDPMTFNELMDLFEAYVATIDQPLMQSVDLIRDELNYREGKIFGHIVGVVDDAQRIAQRLRQIRSLRNTGTDVTITMTPEVAARIESAADETQYLLSHAAAVFGLLHGGIAGGFITGDDRGAMSVMSLAERALADAVSREGESLAKLAGHLRFAAKSIHRDQEKAA